jgi:hypothetical protein
MTMAGIYAVGFCAHYSKQGDWAFDFALDLARGLGLRLNVFHFLADPYDPEDSGVRGLSPEEVEGRAIDSERELRMYYDERLGDYVEAGFRLCEDPEWTELHRCLTKREFQILVLGYPDYRARFAGRSLEEFAHSFVCPVVLVGPTSRHEVYLNHPARMIAERLGLDAPDYHLVQAAAGA